jgi:F-type H+-transporting ATPase subunit epsilon
MRCIVVTPEKTVVDQNASFVALPLYDGELGIAPNHTPLVGRVGCGELRIRAETSSLETSFYIEGGFVEVLDNVVSLLTNQAVPSNMLDAVTAQEELETACGRPTYSSEQMEIREQAIRQARAKLHLAKKIH